MTIGNIRKNLVKIGRIVFELCEWTEKHTERQTDRQTDRFFAPLPNAK